LVGSANLSWSAIARNHELLIKITGESAEVVGDLFELISQNASEVKD
jgi:HKD family nuclease